MIAAFGVYQRGKHPESLPTLGSPGLVRLLINHGADVNMRNSLGMSALMLAKRNVLPDSAAELTRAGAR